MRKRQSAVMEPFQIQIQIRIQTRERSDDGAAGSRRLNVYEELEIP